MASEGGEHVDTLIKGARMIDGTGAPAFQGDLAVKDGRIVAIGELTGWTAENVVEAEGGCWRRVLSMSIRTTIPRSFDRRRCCRRYRKA